MRYLFVLLMSVLTFSCNSDLSETQKKEYIVKGKEIAQATMKELGSNLMKQMKLGGPKMAVPFCNTAAYSLTDKMANKYDVTIKRTSNKLRNLKNSPNSDEELVIKEYIASINNQKPLQPIVKKGKDKKVHFYAPIRLKKKCLACHGTVGKEVSKQTDSIIKSLYPNDKATGFKVGDLRGIWSITFNK